MLLLVLLLLGMVMMVMIVGGPFGNLVIEGSCELVKEDREAARRAAAASAVALPAGPGEL